MVEPQKPSVKNAKVQESIFPENNMSKNSGVK